MTDEHTTKDHAEDDWEAVDVEVARPLGTVISVRFSADVAEQVFERARRRGIATSAYIREAVEQHLEAAWAGRASAELSVSSNDTSVVFYAGRTSTARSAGSAIVWPPVDDVAVTL